MSAVRDRISNDLKVAIKEKDEMKISTLRMIKTEIVKTETSEQSHDLDEAGFVQLLKSMKKQREESIEEYTKCERLDLADKERKEITIIDTYLPSQLSEEELTKLVTEAIAETGAKSMKEIGQVMKAAMAKAAGRADGKRVNALAKAQLSRPTESS